MSKQKKACEKFLAGYSCSQAVFTAYCEEYGIPQDLAVKMTSGFGAGMNMGLTCGVVTGAYMVLGLRCSGDDCTTSTGRQSVYQALASFNDRFTQAHGTTCCRELLGCDISTEKGLTQAKDQKLFTTRCPGFVQTAVEILDGMT